MLSLQGHSRDTALLVARLLMASLFLLAGFDKATNLSAATAYMATTRAPMPEVAAALAAAVELGGGIAIASGLMTPIVAALFVIYVPITAFFGHPYWTVSGTPYDNMLFHFWKNIAIAGGFLLLAVEGAGRYSLDGMLASGLRELHASGPALRGTRNAAEP